jgi:glycosyltransferase involved in cell wall biosynthesis
MAELKIFVRHCNTSSNSVNKTRPEWFSRQKCWDNLKATSEDAEIIPMFDGTPTSDHFLYGEKVISKQGGNDGRSFLNLVEYIYQQDYSDDTLIYILEDDYLHRPGWVGILREGFDYIGVDYLTLYDHMDKYFLPMYEDLQSKILATPTTHWRTIPSTTNTYACRFGTFKKHIAIHREYCDLVKGYTRDHDKFLRLWQEGSNLISCIPGYSTHCETEYLSPCVDWNKI